MDTVSRKTRSAIMRKVRSIDNRSTERRLRSVLARSKLHGWLVRPPGFDGKPDFVFSRKRVAIFVDGCFWHGCHTCYRQPSDHKSYWKAKVLGNQKRDRTNRRRLSRSGWKVVRVLEHELTDEQRRARAIARVREALSNGC